MCNLINVNILPNLANYKPVDCKFLNLQQLNKDYFLPLLEVNWLNLGPNIGLVTTFFDKRLEVSVQILNRSLPNLSQIALGLIA